MLERNINVVKSLSRLNRVSALTGGPMVHAIPPRGSVIWAT